MNTTIVIADDHPLMLRGLSDFIESKGHKIVGSAHDGQSAYNMIVKLKPEIAILDIRMPNKTGIEIAEECIKNQIDTKIILITFDKEEELYDKALELGIYGYILKEFAIEEIETCLENVMNGIPYFSEEIAMYLDRASPKPESLHELTKAELIVLKHIANNENNLDIAQTLSVSVRTIEKHRSNIVTKLKLGGSRGALAVWANLNKDSLKNTW